MENENVAFTLRELFELGGVVMWPLLLFSIIVVFISLERLIYFIYNNRRMNDLTAEVSGFLDKKDFSGAEECLLRKSKRRLGSRILLALIRQSKPEAGRSFSEHRAERAVETEAAMCITSLESGMNFLTALGSLSPLTGFLGTVTGMIGAFRSIAEASEVNAQIVANGIYEALITTVFGLIVAIIAMISHSIFTHFIDKFTFDIEKNCSHLIAEIVEMHEA